MYSPYPEDRVLLLGESSGAAAVSAHMAGAVHMYTISLSLSLSLFMYIYREREGEMGIIIHICVYML